jgi:Tol biopolymer transport system component
VFDLTTGGITPVTIDPEGEEIVDGRPAWSPDGHRIAFQTFRGGDWEIFVANADGTGAMTPLTDNLADDMVPAWQPARP